MRTMIVGVVLLCTVVLNVPVHGQGDILAQIYGEGVHAFNRGDYSCAGSTMDHAINNGSRDPRAYYFRGLAHLRLGMVFEAEDDFRQAATLEAEGTGTYDIGRALERIQGSDRLCLERIRRDTLLAMSQQRRVPSGTMPGEWQGTPQVIPDFGRDLPLAPDPFRDDPRIQILPEEVRPHDVPQAPAPRDVVPPPAPAATPAEEDDPFATGPATEQPESTMPTPDPSTPAPTTPAAPEEADDDIFGDEPSSDNPFE